jgi:hypothetical protein
MNIDVSLGQGLLERNVFPVGKISLKRRDDDSFSVVDDFSTSVILKVIEKSKKVAVDNIFLDFDFLGKNYPGLVDGNDVATKLESLHDYKDHAAPLSSSRKKRVEKAIRSNGGWVVREKCTGTPLKNDRDACDLVGLLKKMQERRGHVFKIPINTSNRIKGDGYQIPTNAIGEKINEIAGKLDMEENAKSNILDNYAFNVYLDVPVESWVLASTVDAAGDVRRAVKRLESEINNASMKEKQSEISGIDDLKRWTSNVLNGGKGHGAVLRKVGFKINDDVLKNPSDNFMKEDFMEPAKGKTISRMNDYCTRPRASLVNHDGKVVEFLDKNGKTLIINDVIGNSTTDELNRWSWYCWSFPEHEIPGGNNAIIPVTFKTRRSLKYRQEGDDSFTISNNAFDEALKDIGTTLWNAMVLSTDDYQETTENAAFVTERMKSVSGVSRGESLLNLVLGGDDGGTMAVIDRAPLPIISRRRMVTREQWIPKKMASEIKKGNKIVGMETDLGQAVLPCR